MNTYFKIAISGAILTLTACQGTNDVIETTETADYTQKICIKVSDTKSRAGRELTSSEAGQSIDNVMLIITDDANVVVWKHRISNWNGSDTSLPTQSTIYSNGRETEIEIPKTECRLLGGAKYHAYAIGYSKGSDFDLSPILEANVGDTYNDNIIITLKGNVPGEEIFAGDCQIIGNVAGIRSELVLNRQVAGTFGYLTKIPYVKDAAGHVGRYLILTMNNAKSSMILGNFDNSNAYEDYSGRYVVNGTGESQSKVLYSINLSNWFGVIEQAIDDENKGTGIIKVDGNWIGDRTRYQKGSVFGGAFIIPTNKTNEPTLQLHLCYANDVSTSMRTWQVTLPVKSQQLTEYTLWQLGTEGWTSSQCTDDLENYNILRNHLYAIGVKKCTLLPYNPENPDDPYLPDEEDDDPEPINNKQEITVTVNHNWSNIYNMDVE